VKTLTAIACCLGLAGGTAQANVNEVQHRYDSARSLCRAWHSDTYCFVTEHRPTVLRLRLTANHHAERLRIDPPFRHPARLSYSPTRLDRALRFTHRLVARLAREPTPEREPPQPAVSDSPLYGPFMCIAGRRRSSSSWRTAPTRPAAGTTRGQTPPGRAGCSSCTRRDVSVSL
jgi:hypothetical protein